MGSPSTALTAPDCDQKECQKESNRQSTHVSNCVVCIYVLSIVFMGKIRK